MSRVNQPRPDNSEPPSQDHDGQIDQICDKFESDWQNDQPPQIEQCLDQVDADQREQLFEELLLVELAIRRKRGEQPEATDYQHRFPEHVLVVEQALPSLPIPDRIGRYAIESVLGQGGFGLVYLGRDDELQRPVVIKVPLPKWVSNANHVQSYLSEARTVASLEHPHIVPVYDVGSTDAFSCYVVSRYIEGSDLAETLQRQKFSYTQAAELIATVADALHYAHTQGVVHRDVKPGNILLDTAGTPYVADFGLALKEENVGTGPRYAGTPEYMSPEQARREGHRVDGRSDIFSLGVVLYQLLVGRRPFQAETKQELLNRIITTEARPPRQIDKRVPRELERICLRSLCQRAIERYRTAKVMADDLRCFLSTVTAQQTPAASLTTRSAFAAVDQTHTFDDTAADTHASNNPPVRILPKGLRSFDAHDADFFLELLPGPRDRQGLPDSLRFWKTRIEQPGTEATFSVGLIYGPSGCGKSSLVKAGLLPRLSEDVIPVYLEATDQQTETSLLKMLRNQCPGLPNDGGLIPALTSLRQGAGVPAGKKVLIVLDQFEQWLQAHKDEQNSELVRALRQCNGENVQAIVLVRDDFWMTATRFMSALEIDLLQGQNTTSVDLFDLRHAKKVLSDFGRAYGAISENPGDVTEEQHRFIDQSLAELQQDGKVICVQLALFAEMVKGKPWTPESLKDVGGTTGVGVTFLEETFSTQTSQPKQRLHQKAARGVLQALLPEWGSNIKGHMRSHNELLEASGYVQRPKDFETLLEILDSELRLITPIDPEGLEIDDDGAVMDADTAQKYYQLTHDYLVPSLRDWLTRKQRETRRGRAELRLAERSDLWNSRPENRHLPSLIEWTGIRLLTNKGKWTTRQRTMMRTASRSHAIRVGTVAAVLAVVSWVGYEISGRAQATGLVSSLLTAETSKTPDFVKQIDDGGYRRWANAELQTALASEPDGTPAKLRAALALLPVDATQVDELSRRLLELEPNTLPTVRDALLPYQQRVVGPLWDVLEDETQTAARRLRAATALATYESHNDPRWEPVLEFVANHMVTTLNESPRDFVPVLKALKPIRSQLAPTISNIARDNSRGESLRDLALNITLDYGRDNAKLLVDLLSDASHRQFATVFPQIETLRPAAIPFLEAELTRVVSEDVDPADLEMSKERLAKRQANAAVALLKLDQPRKVWSVLKHTPDPRTRTYLIHWISPLDADPQTLVDRFQNEPDVSIRRALLLCLGEFDETQLTTVARKPLSESLLDVYRNGPDPGLHGASEWLLRHWGHGKQIEAIDRELQQSNQELRSTDDTTKQWYINGQGQTLVILKAGTFLMGAPESDPDRQPDETLHQRRIDRRFAISSKLVTKAQWRRFSKENSVISPDIKQLSAHILKEDSPMTTMTWYEAAWYCNWLSQQEGIPEDQWCYLPNKNDEYLEGMKAKPDFLELTGYRLPTEPEWEFSCRAESMTSRYYGLSTALLSKYAHYDANSDGKSCPGGRLKPNDFGMFDMLGNAYEWCYDMAEFYPNGPDKVFEDKPPTHPLSDTERRVLRGGASYNIPPLLRSATRYNTLPGGRSIFPSFRVARTYP